MNQSVQSPEVKTKKITVGLISGWFFGIAFLLAGLGRLSDDITSAIIFILAGLVALPPMAKLMRDKAHLSLSGGVRVVIVLVLMFVGVTITGNRAADSVSQPVADSSQSKTETVVPEEVIKVSAVALNDAYKANEVAADAKYKGKLVELSGTIRTIGKDIVDTPYVSFSLGEYSIESVQCMFSKQKEGELSSLSKGAWVTLKGRVSGFLITNTIVRDCEIVR